MATRLEAIASRSEAIASRLEAVALRLKKAAFDDVIRPSFVTQTV